MKKVIFTLVLSFGLTAVADPCGHFPAINGKKAKVVQGPVVYNDSDFSRVALLETDAQGNNTTKMFNVRDQELKDYFRDSKERDVDASICVQFGDAIGYPCFSH